MGFFTETVDREIVQTKLAVGIIAQSEQLATCNEHCVVLTAGNLLNLKFEFTHDNLKAEMKKAIEEQKKVEGIVTVQERDFSPHELEEEDFEQLRLDVVNLAKSLMETDAFQIVEQKIITIMGTDVRLSQASKIYEPQLKILQQELLDIKASL